jgi:hypothetical protein
MGVVPEQSVFAVQPTQVLVDVLQAGVGAVQSVRAPHWTQLPMAVRQTGVAALSVMQSAAVPQAQQVFVV